jgi:hypothetical protein
MTTLQSLEEIRHGDTIHQSWKNGTLCYLGYRCVIVILALNSAATSTNLNTGDFMPALKNPKWEAFAQAVALNMPAAQAYREHVASDPDGPSLSIDPAASKLANDNKVATRIAELRKGVAEKVEKKFDMTKEKWLKRLDGIATKAEEAEDFSAATGALSQIGKASAFYAPEEVKHSGSIGLEVLSEAVAKVFGK